MKSINELTWQGGAIIELKSMLAHVENGDIVSERQIEMVTGAIKQYNEHQKNTHVATDSEIQSRAKKLRRRA
jgi:hypothetical protein